MRCVAIFFTGFLLGLGSWNLFGLSPEQIFDDAYLLGGNQNVILRVVLHIQTPRGAKERELELFLHRSENESKVLAQVVSPSFLRSMKFLQIALADGNEITYLKTSRGVRRLSEANREERLFDSDFTVSDLSYTSSTDYQLQAGGQDVVGDRLCHLLRGVPVAVMGSVDRNIFYVDASDGILRRVDYLDSQDQMVKQYLLLETQSVNGHIYPRVCVMEDFAQTTRTRLTVAEIDVVDSIPARIFSRGNL